MQLAIFDDGQGRWGPLTDTRPIFDVRCGGLTARQRIEREITRTAAALFVPADLEALAQSSTRATVNPDTAAHLGDESCLLVSGRWLALQHRQDVRELRPGSLLLDGSGALVAAHAPDANSALQVMQRVRDAGSFNVDDNMHGDVDGSVRFDSATFSARVVEGQPLIDRPWRLLEQLDSALLSDIQGSAIELFDDPLAGVTVSRQHPARIDPTVKFHPCVVIDTSGGPVHIGAHTEIGAMSVIEGPCYIGEYCQITPHARLRPGTAAGPFCVLGGEVSRTIIQGYSNKAHAGYLGHAIVGQWVNLGADTNVSNLKNTYGSVRMNLEHGGDSEDTGQIKQGPIIGDLTRTAIGSRLMTGSCIGTGTMLALSGFAPKSTRRLSFHTDDGEQPYEIGRFLDSARTAMSRRKVQMHDALEARLRHLAQSAW